MLVHYKKEHDLFKEEYEIKLTDFEARVIFDRLRTYYKFKQQLNFFGYRQSGRCSMWNITVSHNPSLGVLVHEVAHALQMKNGFRQKHKKWHTKKMWKIMERVFRIVNKNKDEWLEKARAKLKQKAETKKRREQKQKEIKEYRKTPEYKLQVIRQRIKSWETKQRRAETYLKKLRRREKILLRKVK